MLLSNRAHFCHGNIMRKMTKVLVSEEQCSFQQSEKCFVQEYMPLYVWYENARQKSKLRGKGGEALNPGVTRNL